LLITAFALVIRWPLHPWLDGGRPYLTLFGGVALVAWLARWRAAVFAAICGYVAANYFLVVPGGTFGLNARAVIEFIAYSASIGLVIMFAELMLRATDREIEQKNLVRVTLASIGDAVITTDFDGRVTFLNPEAEHLTGWNLSEASGRP
jgi:PAS domain-containing protein